MSSNENIRPQPSGFLATLTDEQRTAALSHTGGDTHPQPSGETREAVARIVEALDGSKDRGDSSVILSQSDLRALLSARPAPVASGGQHSSGEVVCVIAFREGKRDPDLVSWNALPVGEHRLYTAPVAETAGEAVARVVRKGLSTGSLFYTQHGQTADLPDGTLLYASPVPAQEDDRVRIAVEALEPFGTAANSAGRNSHTKPNIEQEARRAVSWIDFSRAAKALAALKSTAAQEGGSK